ncbi:MAG: UDP-N-acetylglucosamine--LPS N-acetylglucosamine transferase [Hydrococcus sp. C42_A2020_068]|nr:UDP-N-acetylglucosamine--LPS N-acetylglucosamine transferase [Hydrococcus sp. C42_A2020_068]
MKKVYLMSADMGGGHDSTANALQKAIEMRQLPWQFHVVEFFKEIGGTSLPQTVYNNLVLKESWGSWVRIFNEPILVPSLKLKVRLNYSAWLKRLRSYLYQHKPDIVISLFPYINRILYEGLQATLPNVPFITLPIDFADCPPHFWIEQQDQFLICPTERMVEQAQELGYREEQILRTSGVIINPRFYEPINCDRKVERQRLGLDPDLPTALVMFGGRGSNAMLEVAESLERSPLNLQLILICGRDKKLADTLRRSQSRLLRYVENYTSEIPYYMHLSDFFIGKPGPGSMSEALAMKLPVITVSNAFTMLQERYNPEWIASNGVGIVVRDFREVDRAVAQLLVSENFARYRAKAAALNNQAVFEVVDFLEGILEKSEVRSKEFV